MSNHSKPPRKHYGLKIRNYEAAVLYEYNKGLRTRLDATEAIFSNSLLKDYLCTIGLDVQNEDFTRDIICVKFGFGTASSDEHLERIYKQLKTCAPEMQEQLLEVKARIESNRDHYIHFSADDLRTIFYQDGVTVSYKSSRGTKKIHYRMLYRTSGKAKEGSCMFINERLYDKAMNFIRMGIDLPSRDAPIVEISAYSALIASTIIDRIHIRPEQILILKDVESSYRTTAVSVEVNDQKQCIARTVEDYELKNVLFDGQALIDSSIFPPWANGYILLRQHFTKMAAFCSNIQDFFKDYFGKDYETATVTDMWGRKMKASEIRLITTDNAVKWLKFNVSREYWDSWLEQNDCLFGIVKTAHASKMGNLQRMSYQMVNTLDMATMETMVQTSRDYVNRLKSDNAFFLQYLKNSASFINDYDVLAALAEHNPDFINSDYFRERRYKIIDNYITNFKNGRLLQDGDNLVICGSPYAMLLHAVGEDPLQDPTFTTEDGAIQCWTERFDDGEYLAEFRSPFNSRNNLGCLHNVQHELLDRYFRIGRQCVAVNMIGTCFQARNNGSDQDSDSVYATNQADIVNHAKFCMHHYPTIENNIPKEKNHYPNTIEAFAEVDNRIAAANQAIGQSSNLAQLCLTYTYNFDDQKFQDYACILAVIAQAAIDNAKRTYDIDLMAEISRIKKDMELDKNGYPYFWFMLKRKSKFAKQASRNGGHRQMKGLNNALICPMNYVCDLKFKKFRSSEKTIPIEQFLVHYEPPANYRRSRKVEALIEKYCIDFYNQNQNGDVSYELLDAKIDQLVKEIQSVYISGSYRHLVCWLIERAFGCRSKTKGGVSNVWRNRPVLLKTLYRVNPKVFMECFKRKEL